MLLVLRQVTACPTLIVMRAGVKTDSAPISMTAPLAALVVAPHAASVPPTPAIVASPARRSNARRVSGIPRLGCATALDIGVNSLWRVPLPPRGGNGLSSVVRA